MNEPTATKPALSVLLITPDTYATIADTVDRLLAQDERGDIELIITVPSAADLDPDEAKLSKFFGHRIIELGEIDTTGIAMARGFLAATSDIVAYCEEHSYPQRGWAGRIVTAYRGPWAAVGWSVTNHETDSIVGWSSLFTDFGPWVAPAVSGERNALATHQLSYRTVVLREFEDELPDLLEHETVFMSVLRERGHRLYLEADAVSDHLSVSRFRSYLRSEFMGARVFAANRAHYGRWSVPRRLFYAAAWPLRPLVRLRRITSHIRRTGNARRLIPGVYPVLTVALVGHAVGEAFGYLIGKGASARNRASIELNRARYVR